MPYHHSPSILRPLTSPSMVLPSLPIEESSPYWSLDALVLYLIHPKNQPRCPRDYSHRYTPSAPYSRCAQENFSATYYPPSRLLLSFQGSDFFHASLFLLPHSLGILCLPLTFFIPPFHHVSLPQLL